MATAELRELGGCCGGARTGEGGGGNAKTEAWLSAGGAGELKARPGASWPARTDRRRRAAVSRATRRAKPAGVGH